MNFNIYMIDDNEIKVRSLDAFICWLRTVFPAHEFAKGFKDPLKSSESADEIQRALNDPIGVILLDVKMDGVGYRNAKTALVQNNAAYVSEQDVTAFQSRFLKKVVGGELAAAVAIIARHRNVRIAWCSRQDDDTNAYNNIGNLFPQLPWPLAGEAASWDEEKKMTSILRPFHQDARINDAICFAMSPEPGPQWDHNSLMTAGKEHNLLLAKWLTLGGNPCDGESAKALLCPNKEGDWMVRAGPDAYQLEADILVKACEKLGVPLGCQTNSLFRLPVQPGFPFLLSFADLYWQMSQPRESTFPPVTLLLSRVHGDHQLRLALSPLTKTGEPVNMDQFNAVFLSVLDGSKMGGHATSIRLCNLRKAKIGLEHSLDKLRQTFFDGVDGSPNVTIEFDKNQKEPAVLVKWSVRIP